ncbi:MAG: hypothetical protein HND57_02560 [Planctomycetes bacterium]|nr:hypothetical protein [Planctomycetota bacterium]
MWGTPFLRDDLAELDLSFREQRSESLAPNASPELNFEQAGRHSQKPVGRLASIRHGATGGNGLLRRPELALPHGFSVREWIYEVRKLVSHEFLRGIVLTGEFARPNEESSPLIESLLTGLAEGVGTAVRPVLREGPADVAGALHAEGAATFLSRHIAGQPTYLDSLPEIETLVQRQGEPYWLNLIEQVKKYVLGGRRCRFEPPDLKLKVQAEERRLTLKVGQEGYPTVRQVSKDFRSALDSDVEVGLKIEIVAAQGNPRVEVIPVDRAALRGERVYLQWERAVDTGKTRKEVEDEEPRTNPRLEQRLASRECWLGSYQQKRTCDIANEALRQLERGNRIGQKTLASLRDALRESDKELAHAKRTVHATAFDSDGQLAPAVPGQQLARSLLDKLDESLALTAARALPPDVYRVLGYTSASTANLVDILKAKLRRLAQSDSEELQALLIAYGNCLRDPGDIALFAQSMEKNFRSGRPSRPSDWMRALCRMLMYRPDAARDIDSDLCLNLIGHCFKIAVQQINDMKAAKIRYRHAALCLAYILRRRRYDETFLPPDEEPAVEMKSFLMKAAKGMKSGRIECHGGFVDLPAVTEIIVDYIDRRGTGILLLFD